MGDGNKMCTVEDVRKFFRSAAPDSCFKFYVGTRLTREFIIDDFSNGRHEDMLNEVAAFLFDCSLRGSLRGVIKSIHVLSWGEEKTCVEFRISVAKKARTTTNIDADMIDAIISGMRTMVRMAFAEHRCMDSKIHYGKAISRMLHNQGQVLFKYSDHACKSCAESMKDVVWILNDAKYNYYIDCCLDGTIYLKEIDDWLIDHNITEELIDYLRDHDEISHELPLFDQGIGMP